MKLFKVIIGTKEMYIVCNSYNEAEELAYENFWDGGNFYSRKVKSINLIADTSSEGIPDYLGGDGVHKLVVG